MSLPSPNNYGQNGQYPRSTGNGIEWVDYGLPSDEQTSTAISNWLDNHPEATTSVENHSLTNEKLVIGTLNFVTPEMYGAKGDGTTDDSEAIQQAVNSGLEVKFKTGHTYICNNLSQPPYICNFPVTRDYFIEVLQLKFYNFCNQNIND